jgi:hypothetical protein
MCLVKPDFNMWYMIKWCKVFPTSSEGIDIIIRIKTVHQLFVHVYGTLYEVSRVIVPKVVV